LALNLGGSVYNYIDSLLIGKETGVEIAGGAGG